eukprot:EC097459.1.p1 GENE.EC097459.1~~EC097459.1.p1  ORF type:complete len:137 (-),score=8.75 EC097459.1:215-625(-)
MYATNHQLSKLQLITLRLITIGKGPLIKLARVLGQIYCLQGLQTLYYYYYYYQQTTQITMNNKKINNSKQKQLHIDDSYYLLSIHSFLVQNQHLFVLFNLIFIIKQIQKIVCRKRKFQPPGYNTIENQNIFSSSVA